MKKRKWIIGVIIGIIIAIVAVISYLVLNNSNKLTSLERTWINENINSVQNVYVSKDENIFGKEGNGIFYRFLDDFSKKYDLNINVITLDGNESGNTTLKAVRTIKENDKVFYTDHYVLASKNYEIINSLANLENKTIGVLNSDIEYIKSYIKIDSLNIIGFEDTNALYESLNGSTQYIILPRMRYIDLILSKKLEIVYHFNDINIYYTLNSLDNTFNNILNKYFVTWKSNINEEIKKEEFQLFTKALEISETDIDKLLSIDYKYGFINNSPYEVILGGKYGGVIAKYLEEFSDFSKVHFDITKYKNINKLAKATVDNKVDLYFEFDKSISNDFFATNHGINTSFSIITPKNSDKIIDSIFGLQNETVYVQNNTNLLKYLLNIDNVNIVLYNNDNELFNLNNKDAIIVIDTNIFNCYSKSKLSNYMIKYTDYLNDFYRFKINKKHTVLSKLFNSYINYLDDSKMLLAGINNYDETVLRGNILISMAKYFILITIAAALIGFVIYRNSKRIRVARRIKKDDKVRFIDDLTMLKNRAYLKDFLKTWNNNTIYPQTVIVVGLKKLQEINDKYGVEEGDKQIQAVANALIKTQLDNSDLMRSDGNEFVVYAVGYSHKQIVNYIHKLNKELKKLPYSYGCEYGYSIIENNLKTVEDALSEATMDMKNKKDGAK